MLLLFRWCFYKYRETRAHATRHWIVHHLKHSSINKSHQHLLIIWQLFSFSVSLSIYSSLLTISQSIIVHYSIIESGKSQQIWQIIIEMWTRRACRDTSCWIINRTQWQYSQFAHKCESKMQFYRCRRRNF